MNKMNVTVIADSISPYGVRIVTLHARYPRIIHGEVMTHRVFSRNARSSRAVPVLTMLNEVRNDPFIPWHWGKNQKGMQASEECNAKVYDKHDLNNVGMAYPRTREQAWLDARNIAADIAEAYMDAGYHKQIANRLLEPFSYIDTLITSTSWNNFFHLRDHEDAEPHFHDLAKLIKEKMNASKPRRLFNDQWHLPYVTKDDELDNDLKTNIKLSVARCARISYKPFDGDGSIAKEIERHDMLVASEPLHASPAEHQATPGYEDTANFEGWKQYRKTLKNEFIYD